MMIKAADSLARPGAPQTLAVTEGGRGGGFEADGYQRMIITRL